MQALDAVEKMYCQKCGKETFLPFQCPYCGEKFCSEHRLPENHSCSKMEMARTSKQEDAFPTSSSYKYTVTMGQSSQNRGRVYISPKEVKHLLVATLLVAGVGLSSILYYDSELSILGLFALILTVSFLSHEIAHKFTAQTRGLWAEFRLTTWGALLTLMSVILPTFKIISPGAVMISGSLSLKEMGLVSLSGPATNILFSAAFSALALVPGSYQWIFSFAAFLNAFMALFNLIPFGILDGYKIFLWDKKTWGVAFAAAIALMIVNYVSI